MGKLSGRGAIVTGGAQGIGGATARRLASDGATVLIVDIDKDAAETNVDRIKQTGGSVLTMIADISKPITAKSMVEMAMDEIGRLDILVQNAYGGGEDSKGSAVEISVDSWMSGMDQLVTALYLGAKYAVPAMERSGSLSGHIEDNWNGSSGRRSGKPPKINVGRIINISSVHGLLQAPRSLIYEAGKSAVIGLTKQMAIDFGPLGITVNAIAPGHIVTERVDAGWSELGNDEGFRLFELQYPVRRTGIPDDIAASISFLVSDEASFVTGVLLPVDGGLSIQLQENIVMDVKDYIVSNPNLKTHHDSVNKRGNSRF